MSIDRQVKIGICLNQTPNGMRINKILLYSLFRNIIIWQIPRDIIIPAEIFQLSYINSNEDDPVQIRGRIAIIIETKSHENTP